MRRVLIAAMQAVLFGCIPAFAQVGGMGSPTPAIGATSSLGMAPGLPVPPTGIPMGATELASPGLSGVPAGTMGMTGNGTTCLVMGSPSSGMSGSSTNFDGGGLGAGTGTLPGGAATSGTCGTSSSSGASSDASSSAATSPTSPGGGARTGIPLGSVARSATPGSARWWSFRRPAQIPRRWEAACHVRQTHLPCLRLAAERRSDAWGEH